MHMCVYIYTYKYICTDTYTCVQILSFTYIYIYVYTLDREGSGRQGEVGQALKMLRFLGILMGASVRTGACFFFSFFF